MLNAENFDQRMALHYFGPQGIKMIEKEQLTSRAALIDFQFFI
jgi:hypothetical protein